MKLLAVGALLIFASSALNGQVVLDINVLSANSMVITATGRGPVTTDSSHSYFDGIDLEGLFTPNANAFNTDGTVVIASTLTTGVDSSGSVYNLASVDSVSEPNADLNLSKGDISPQKFTFGQPAFTFGTSLTVNFSGLTFSGLDYGVVVAGNSGLLVSFNFPSTDGTTPIGVYHIVGNTAPEPSTYAMMLAGLGFLAFCVRRKLA